MRVVALCIGDVGRDRNAARRHDRKVSNAPFGAVLGDEGHPIAFIEPYLSQGLCQKADLIGHFGPADSAPLAFGFEAKKGCIGLLLSARKEQLEQIVCAVYILKDGMVAWIDNGAGGMGHMRGVHRRWLLWGSFSPTQCPDAAMLGCVVRSDT